jgi:hypothetical protein
MVLFRGGGPKPGSYRRRKESGTAFSKNVAHTWELLPKLKKDYYHARHGENRGGLHTSSI